MSFSDNATCGDRPPSPSSSRAAATMQAHERALERYVARPYAGSVVLLRARDRGGAGLVDGAEDIRLGWSALCTGPLHVEVVPGTHQTMILPPHVEEVARVIDRILERGAGEIQGPESERHRRT